MAECFDGRTEQKSDKIFTVAGFPFPVSCLFTPESTKRAFTLSLHPGDVVLSSYPKCDSKLVDEIIWKLLYMDLKHPPINYMTNSFLPCMEMSIFQELSNVYQHISRHKLPKLLKTYLPFKLIPFYRKAKYIYVIRTPWEVCSSYYRFLSLCGTLSDSFNIFVNNFVQGHVPYGSYFKHILPWNKRINESNILVLCHEHVEHNPRSAMFTIAAFLGDRYLAQLLNNCEIERNILNSINWDKLKTVNERVLKYYPVNSESLPEAEDSFAVDCQCEGFNTREDSKPCCNETQLKLIIEKVSEKFKDTSLEFLWLSVLKKQAPALFA